MAGEISGTTVLVSKGAGVIVGQMEATVTFNGTPIDVSNKSSGNNIVLLDNELAGKQMQIAGTIVYNNDTVYRAIRADALIGAQDTYTITYAGATTTQESFSATMVPTGLSDALPHGDKVSTSITLLSSGVITHIAAA